jgi:formamidopyrimidine-DNA glycosylase
MPELPEVETTRRGITPHILNQRVARVTVRERQLRWPVPAKLPALMQNQEVSAVNRRAKYLLIETGTGTLMVHLGMSGSLRIVSADQAVLKHDHVDISFANGNVLRFRDPRKFGSMHWITGDVAAHPLLCDLGPEPLAADFDSDYLFARSRKRKAPVKAFIMDSHVVVGVGNIYANEALFRAGIRPTREAGKISAQRYALLVAAIKEILAEAIRVGGTTLRDFLGSDGEPGYFSQSLAVYGRGEMPCVTCSSVLKEIRLGQRSTVFCGKCQR